MGISPPTREPTQLPLKTTMTQRPDTKWRRRDGVCCTVGDVRHLVNSHPPPRMPGCFHEWVSATPTTIALCFHLLRRHNSERPTRPQREVRRRLHGGLGGEAHRHLE